MKTLRSLRRSSTVGGGARFVTGWLKLRLLRALYRSRQDAFVRLDDHMRYELMVEGEYERDTDAVLRLLTPRFGDFFIDVGANIGLIAMRQAPRVPRSWCVEPNPMLQHVLRANLALAGATGATVLPFGIGERDETVTLTVPRSNHGGAFVRAQNRYDEQVLSGKDGLAGISEATHVTVPIALRDGRAVFAELAAELHAEGRRAGLVKIDVEGMELTVLRALLPALAGLRWAVLFESWTPMARAELTAMLPPGQPLWIYQLLGPTGLDAMSPSRIVRFVRNLRASTGRDVVALEPGDDTLVAGDVVLASEPIDWGDTPPAPAA